MLLSLLSLVCLLGAARARVQNSTSQTFVFVSGWPQSGTSLVQQIFTEAPKFSTMVNRCHSQLGKYKCERWNNEGQWLLGIAPVPEKDVKALEQSKALLMPGAMCVPPAESLRALAADEGARDSLRRLLLSQWGHFWDMSQPFLTEKSPQSMLKIPLLRMLFRDSKSQQQTPHRAKFLIVIKHPASLNVAVPKSMDWLTHDEPGDTSVPKKKLANTKKQMSDNVDFFIDFLAHGDKEWEAKNGDSAALSKAKSRRACSLGWIPAMEQLEQHLNASRSDSLSDVRILRYEHFERPTVVCRALFDFMFDSDLAGYNDAVKSVCNVHFPLPKRSASSAGAGRNSRFRRPGNRESAFAGAAASASRRLDSLEPAAELARRKLRLHTPEDGRSNHLLFRHNALSQSVFERLQNYFALFHHHEAVSNDQRETLRRLDKRLKRFGYRVAPREIGEKLQRVESAFDEYDIFIAYNQKKLAKKKL